MFRHTQHEEWKHLINLLTSKLAFYEIDSLTDASLIRKEWRTEPSSWVYSLTSCPHIISIILEESEEGLWVAL